MDKRIVGVYDNGDEAVRAIEDLKAQGYDRDAISVVARDRDDIDEIHEETDTKAEEGLATGAATGGVLGGLAGFLAGVGALAIPGVGPILAAGPIAATLTGAAVGAGAGGLAGALIGMGIPEDEANRYESDVKAGKILVLVDEDENRLGTGRTGAVTENSNEWSGSTTMDDPTMRTGNDFGTGTVDANRDTLGGNLNNDLDRDRNRDFTNRTTDETSGMMSGGASMGSANLSDMSDYPTGSDDNLYRNDPSAINQNTAGAAFGTDEDTIKGGAGGNSTLGTDNDPSLGTGTGAYNPGLGSDPNLSNTPNAKPESSFGDSMISNDPFRGTDDTLRETNKNRDSFDDRFDGEGRDNSKR
ncbi:hypothetical protein D1B31_07160 [Neobacillus notoginsengisoli]|uniref:General stress protein 17M-like domain-containing protein n=1 Tax=Neobacillus notoginsengisoli TaxID=1578198 RepID=A0A417YVZ3_9BACI|nr:general stress protein [Neobacillus notoginsengisoli]RHW41494.1 hypothetical protein D1B31_07160 [Neobacillus notoginsengisoli]